MTAEEFEVYRHEAVHQLMDLNEWCDREFSLSTWPRWDYDLDAGTLTFSQDNVPKVIADVQVVGTTADDSNTWLWGWANSSLPNLVTCKVESVREFGVVEEVTQLRERSLVNEEALGWALTSIAARILGAKGGYRCPGDNGFVYLIYTHIAFAGSEEETPKGSESLIDCGKHKRGFQTFICEHLAGNPQQRWFSSEPDEDNPWPDAWCKVCNEVFEEEGEWNDRNSDRLKANVVCHHCYQSARATAMP